MTDCCEVPGAAAAAGAACPTCGHQTVAVELGTVKALLTEAAMRRVSATPHRFCRSAVCPTVYVDAEGQAFGTSDIRVPVWQKEPFGRRMICYCFGENEADIRAEIERTGQSDAVQRVRGHIAAGRCACELRNPHGTCCLGDVMQAVAEAKAMLQPSEG
jgi:hypothetical protein